MNFLAPGAFFFAAAIPVVIVFYLLKRKRVVRLVGSTLLWQKFLAETQASAPFQKLRHNWLLLLQILMLLLAILALARPYFSGKTGGGRLLVLILDASASMQSVDETPSRFEKARKDALKLVDSLHDDDRMVVLLAAGNADVRQSATTEKSALKRAIESSLVTDSGTHLGEALKLAETLIQNQTKSEIHLYSDGATRNLVEFENKGLPVVYHKVGERHVNMGIVNLDARPNPENPTQRAIFATVANYSTNAAQNQLELRFGEKILEVKSLNLKPMESVPVVFIASQSQDGVFEVRLTEKDDLAADNQASIVSLLPQPVKVLLVTSGNRFLEKALKASPNVELSKAENLTDSAKGYDLVVLDNVIPLVWPQINTLAFHVAGTNWFDGWKKVDAPQIVDWKSSHPLLRFVSFDTVQISETLGVKGPSWAVSLAESPQTPLILAGELGRQRVVWVGFDSLLSTWPLRISFPIFVANAVDWLNPASAQAGQLNIRAGDPFRLSMGEGVTSAEITLPDGSSRQRSVDAGKRELVFGDTSRQGIYKLKAGTNQVVFCVNLLDSQESDTTPKPELQFGKYAKVGASNFRQANMEIWRWIALSAFCVLMFEWWYYHRRTA